MEIVHTTDSWGSEKSLGLFFNDAIFFDILPRLATGTGANSPSAYTAFSRHDAPPGKVAGNPLETTVKIGSGFTGW